MQTMDDTEKLRLAAHTLLKSATDYQPGLGQAPMLEELDALGLLDAEGAAAIAKAAHFLVAVLYSAHKDIAEGYRAGGLALVLKYQIDQQFLPGGDAPSPN